MPISAIGNRRGPDSGFSLIETMTALLIVGLMAGAVLILAPGPDAETKAFADRFAARVALASDESIIDNRPFALVMTREGHGYQRLDEAGWAPVESRSPLAFRAWPADIDYAVAGENDAASGDRVVRFDALGGATPARIVFTRAGARWQIDIDGQGRAHVSQIR